jgi:hypothetical protein
LLTQVQREILFFFANAAMVLFFNLSYREKLPVVERGVLVAMAVPL